jgi:Aldo/keto reductase family
VPYSPLGHGFLTGTIRSPEDLADDDWRKNNPRFTEGNFEKNLRIVDEVKAVASKLDATPAQIALTWLCFRLRGGASADDVVVLDRPERGGGSGRDADLRVDVLDVVVGGLGGDDESVGDLAGREATRGELEHVDFPA